MRLGLDVTGNCALLDRSGAISRRLFAVGLVTRGAFWEMTAVPDIRRQTEKLMGYLEGLVKTSGACRTNWSLRNIRRHSSQHVLAGQIIGLQGNAFMRERGCQIGQVAAYSRLRRRPVDDILLRLAATEAIGNETYLA